MPRLARYVITAALLGLWGVSLHSARAQSLRPGTEVFAVEPGKVIEITYRSPTMLLLAHRWQTRDRFALIFLEKPHPPVTCLAGQKFDVVLNQMTSLKLRRTLTPTEAQELLKKNPFSSWAEVVIRDNTALEPFRALLLPVTGQSDAAFVHFGDVTYVVDFADQVFQLISSGCKSLAATSPPQK
jgi:hypothetical protein